MYNVYGTKTKPTSDNLFYILFLCSLILLEDCVARNAHHHAIAISYCSCVCYADAKNGVVQDNFSTANNIPFDAVKWRLWLIERVFCVEFCDICVLCGIGSGPSLYFVCMFFIQYLIFKRECTEYWLYKFISYFVWCVENDWWYFVRRSNND